MEYKALLYCRDALSTFTPNLLPPTLQASSFKPSGAWYGKRGPALRAFEARNNRGARGPFLLAPMGRPSPNETHDARRGQSRRVVWSCLSPACHPAWSVRRRRPRARLSTPAISPSSPALHPPRRSLRSTPTGTPKAGGSRRLEPLSVTATVCGAYDPSLAAYIDLCLSCRRPTSLPRRLQLARRTSKQYLINWKQRTAYNAHASTHASRQALWLSEPVEPNSAPFSIERTHCWNSS